MQHAYLGEKPEEEKPLPSEDIIAALRSRVAGAGRLDARVRFDLGQDGAILVDGHALPAHIVGQDGDADVTVHISEDHLEDILGGRLDPMLAFMTGRLKVRGDMQAAMRIAKMLGR